MNGLNPFCEAITYLSPNALTCRAFADVEELVLFFRSCLERAGVAKSCHKQIDFH
eukprot:m.25543 g.25543  ORF g.25543 m.25543 type:complete len:55 (-) comp6212_c0_seq1:1260-1424(-)